MVNCPRCQQPVDETARTTCPLCFTPLVGASGSAPAPGMPGSAPGSVPPLNANALYPSAPPPTPGVMPLNGPAPLNAPAAPMPGVNAMPGTPMGMPLSTPTIGANQRMTLTGEVIDAPAPMAQASMGNSQYQARPAYGAPRREEVSAPSGGGAKTGLIALVLFVLLGGGAFGGWYLWMHRTNPKDQAQKFFAALKAMDTKAMYETVEINGEKYKDEQDFITQNNTQLDKNPAAKQMLTSMFEGLTFKAGEPKYDSATEATIPVTTSGTMSFLGQSQSVNQTTQVKMKNFNGIWKVSKDNALGQGIMGGKGNMGGLGALGGGG
jgi:hypothetical protein